MYLYIFLYLVIYLCIYLFLYLCIYLFIYLYMYTHIYIYIYTHVYIIYIYIYPRAVEAPLHPQTEAFGQVVRIWPPGRWDSPTNGDKNGTIMGLLSH